MAPLRIAHASAGPRLRCGIVLGEHPCAAVGRQGGTGRERAGRRIDVVTEVVTDEGMQLDGTEAAAPPALIDVGHDPGGIRTWAGSVPLPGTMPAQFTVRRPSGAGHLAGLRAP